MKNLHSFTIPFVVLCVLTASNTNALPQQNQAGDQTEAIAHLKSELALQKEHAEQQLALDELILQTTQNNLTREKMSARKFSLFLFTILSSSIAIVCFCIGFGFGQQKLLLYRRKKKRLHHEKDAWRVPLRKLA